MRSGTTGGSEGLLERFTAAVAAGRTQGRLPEAADPSVYGSIITSEESVQAMNLVQDLIGGASCLEIGTYFASTTRHLAIAAARSGGKVVTIDPYGADRIPGVMATWPENLRAVTEFQPVTSMSYFSALNDQGVPKGRNGPFDLVFVDGNHDYEFALFDIQVSALWLKPGGVIVIDNIDQGGPLKAAQTFLKQRTHWRAFEQGGGRPLEAFPGSNAAFLFAPNGIEVDDTGFKLRLRDLPSGSLAGVRIPVVGHEGEGELNATLNFFFMAYDAHLKPGGVLAKVSNQKVRVDRGATEIKFDLSAPVTIDPPAEREGFFGLELELSYERRGGANLLLDAAKDIAVS